jgi:serine/threonine protein kinase
MAGEFPGLYALKPLKNTGLLERFRREVDVTRNLNHPNILRVGDVDLNDKAPFYVAKWCEAGSLEEIGGESFRGNITLGLRRGDRTPVLGKLVFTLPAGGRNESD